LSQEKKIYYRQRNGTHFKPGDPRYIRVYDNLGETLDRYTVTYTRGIQFGKHKTYFVLGMNCAPFSPQGIGQHSEYGYRVDFPSYKHLGKRIGFSDLPENCQRAVDQDYLYLYDLNEDSNRPVF
jgi:hypothetical protein